MTSRVDLRNGVAVFATAVFDDHDQAEDIFMDVCSVPSINLRIVMSCDEAAALRDALAAELEVAAGDGDLLELRCLSCGKPVMARPDSPVGQGIFLPFCRNSDCEDAYAARL